MSSGADRARRLVVLRHGESTHNAAGIWQGQLDVPLSAKGVAQAAAAGAALRSLHPARVVSSDLARAAATGQAVSSACAIPMTLDPRLREVDAGAWQGLTGDEVSQGWPQEWSAVLRGEDVPRGVHGETMGQVARRVGECLDEVVAAMAPGECVVVATHGAAGRAAVAQLLGLDQELAWRILGGFGNCHWSELVQGRRGWFVRTWNVSAVGDRIEAASPP